MQNRLRRFQEELSRLDLRLPPPRPEDAAPEGAQPPAAAPEPAGPPAPALGILEDILRLQAEARAARGPEAQGPAAADPPAAEEPSADDEYHPEDEAPSVPEARSGGPGAPRVRILGAEREPGERDSRESLPAALARKPLPWVLLLAGAAGAFALARHANLPRSASVSAGPVAVSIAFPAERPCGLAVSDGAFISVDSRSRALVVLNPSDPKFVRKVPLPEVSAGGVAAGRGSIWTVDPARGLIFWLDADTCEVRARVPSPGPRPESIYMGPNTLWTTDASTSKVYRHALDEQLTVVASAQLPREPVAGMARSGNDLWVAFGPSRTLRRYDVTAGISQTGQAELSRFLPRGSKLAGLALEDGWAWALTESPAQLTRISREQLKFK